MIRTLSKRFTIFVGVAIVLTGVFGTMYTVVQQIIRLDANDPQIQLAQDTAAQLDAGQLPTGLITTKININTSLSPFIIIYDLSGHVVAGSGYLDGSVPVIPYGVLQHTTTDHYNWVSWQPQASIRLASVEVKANHYYVLSARSLSEIEKRESIILQETALGWFLSLAVLGATFVVSSRSTKR